MGTIKHMPAKHAYTLFLLLLFINLHHSAAVVASKDKVEDAVPVPVPVPVVRSEYRMVETILEHGQRRKLAPFQVCLVCRCCVMASDPTTCSNLPCCFGIDCQLPNKPFGVCAFVPKTCNCTSCASP